MMTIAILSDTHGLLRPEIPNAIKDVDHIIHASDLGKMEILDELSRIAPTSIVNATVRRLLRFSSYSSRCSIVIVLPPSFESNSR
jgi:predicted phosphodiesterase